jgi:predicted PhzF superfamily epimerase YddE/YHI9
VRLRSFTPAGAEVGGAGRPSLIQVAVSAQRVRVGGSGLVVADGTLAIP